MITQKQNAAISLAKAYVAMAVAAGEPWHVTNAHEHLDCACDNGAATFDFDSVQHALAQITEILVRQGEA